MPKRSSEFFLSLSVALSVVVVIVVVVFLYFCCIVINFSEFHLLFLNNSANLIQTRHKASLVSLC